jgi:diguanylate cyclase (GGDEF)-like protein
MTSPTEPPNGRSDAAEIRRTAWDTDQTIADSDQTASDADQTAADSDQIASDRDQQYANLDRSCADADQRSADLDQAIADREAHDGNRVDQAPAAREEERDLARRFRADTAAARAQTAISRAENALGRFAEAEGRDDAARARDLASEARDLAADTRDRAAALEEPSPRDAALQRAAADRARAAEDRHHAAQDREHARVDRHALRAALSEAQFDDLTGTYQRATGTIALQAEIDRVRRSHGRLVLAFVDVDALKAHNDRDGHAAGDKLLVDVVASIRSKLRSYDPIVRFGGDEFVCALADADGRYARKRFRDIQTTLEQTHAGASISAGFAELEMGDTLDSLIERGDEALQNAKQQR